MTVKIKDKDLYDKYLKTKQETAIANEDDNIVFVAFCFLSHVSDDNPIKEIQTVVNAIFNGEDVKYQADMYEIPLPNLMTSDGVQQYLSRRSLGSYFASRKMDIVCSKFTELELNTKVPKIYRQFAQKVED